MAMLTGLFILIQYIIHFSRQIEIIPSNLRQVLDTAFYLIRIPAMKIEEFVNGMAQSGLLGYQKYVYTVSVYSHCIMINSEFQAK